MLKVLHDKGLLTMDFPAQPPSGCKPPPALVSGLGRNPLEVLASEDYFVVYGHEEDILSLAPDMQVLAGMGLRGVIVTAPGRESDFVSRFFAPGLGIPEDPVTGSAHCALTPYWSGRLQKKKLTARQLSRRGGELHCVDAGDRVLISGQAVTYLRGMIVV
jgi:PhzF family phenazine biosynthesis protein